MTDLDFITLLTRSGTYVMAIAVFIATWFIRTITENVWPKLKKQADANDSRVTYLTAMSRWWNEVMLYAIPVLIGGTFGLMNSSFFFGDIVGFSSKATLGGVVGWLSSFLYKVMRKTVKQRLGIDLLPDQDAPMLTDQPPGPTS